MSAVVQIDCCKSEDDAAEMNCEKEDSESAGEQDAEICESSTITVGQGKDGLGGREETHPLFNYHVLADIFYNLDLKGIKSARLVCKSWMNQIDPFLQKHSQIRIIWNDSKESPSSPALPTFMKYVDSVTPAKVFFRNYTLKDWWLHSKEVQVTRFFETCGPLVRDLVLSETTSIYEESCLRNLFFYWTPNMESIALVDVHLYDGQYCKAYEQEQHVKEDNDEQRPPQPEPEPRAIRRIFGTRYPDEIFGEGMDEDSDSDSWDDDFQDYGNVPPMAQMEYQKVAVPNLNMKVLKLNLSSPYSFPLHWMEIFEAFPNLEVMEVDPIFQPRDHIMELLRELKQFLSDNPSKLQNLKTLDIFSDHEPETSADEPGFRNEHFELASELNLKLTSAKIGGSYRRDLCPYVVGNYINTLSGSLERLELDTRESTFPIFPISAQTRWRSSRAAVMFPHLTDLITDLASLAVSSLEFLENLPKLEALIIADGELWDSSSEEDGVNPKLVFNTITLTPKNHLSLTTLSIQENILSVGCIEKIGEWFLNLTKFVAILDDPMVAALWRYLQKTNLQVLIIDANRVTDAGIAGTVLVPLRRPGENLEFAEEECPQDKKFKDNEFMEMDAVPRISIGNLKKLRYVVINEKFPTKQFSEELSTSLVLTDTAVYDGFNEMEDLHYLRLPDTMISETAFRDLCSRFSVITLHTPKYYRGDGIDPKTKIKI